ncbi:unnamed protein product [Cladocopium goreaui]|uniref:Ricin B lectin domain-containing protein n=1 Tax=Cladocopium goreaui TaxID=2562237 RepID=A0A9P1DN39_9DINO|nr:unnamed protein product [Cladocopium goreaui]
MHIIICIDRSALFHTQIPGEKIWVKACGGGLREATAFRYYSEPLLVGDAAGQVKGYPLPRTASRYSVDSNCGLLGVNLTIDGNTGELRLVPGCSSVGCGHMISDFMITCTITAHEGSLEASTQMMITGSRFMVWQNSVLLVPPGLTQSFPSRSVCDWGQTSTSSPVQYSAMPCLLEMVCVPLSTSWLQLQNNGGLTVSNDAPAASEIPGLTALNNLEGLEVSSGSLCTVRNVTNGTASPASPAPAAASVLALVPQAWSSIKYGYETVSVDLNTTLQPALEPKDGGAHPGRVAPMRFSASCVTDVSTVSVDFDELTGLATAQGYRIFHLDVRHGVLQISPEANLSHLFDQIQLNRVRAGIHVSCSILGHFGWQVGVPVPPIKGTIKILVQDSTCWIEPEESQYGWQQIKSFSASAEECRKACRADGLCGVYSVDAGCKFLAPCGPHPVKECTTYTKVAEKVTNCGLGYLDTDLTS